MLNHLNQDNDDQSFPMKPQRVLSDVRKVMKEMTLFYQTLEHTKCGLPENTTVQNLIHV